MGLPNPSRESKFSGANREKEIFIFPVQLITSRIGNLTRLILTLAVWLMTIYTVHDIITMQGHQTKQFLCTMLKTSDLPVALFAFFKTLTHTFWFYRYIYLYLFPLAFTYITCKSIVDATCKLRLLPLHQLL